MDLERYDKQGNEWIADRAAQGNVNRIIERNSKPRGIQDVPGKKHPGEKTPRGKYTPGHALCVFREFPDLLSDLDHTRIVSLIFKEIFPVFKI